MTAQQKTCSKCGQAKDINEYYSNKRSADGYNYSCKQCEKERQSVYNRTETGKNKARARNRKWESLNRDRLVECRKVSESKRSKTTHRREYNKNYRALRRKDPLFRLRNNISRQISFMLREKNGSKRGESILQHLGYTIDELKNHLESQFDQNMNWNNYGSYWNIDHIYPQSLLPFSSMDDENFIKCWALSNLRPLEAKENIRKSNKVCENPLFP